MMAVGTQALGGQSPCIFKNSVFFLFDTETSGFQASVERIVEICVALYTHSYFPNRSDMAHDKFSSLVNPERPLSRRSIDVHKITNKMLNNQPTFPTVWKKFKQYVERNTPAGCQVILVAHKADFDARFLCAELSRCSLPLPDWKITCTLKLVRSISSHKTNTLSEIASRYGVSSFDAHRASGDVLTLGSVLSALERSGDAQPKSICEMMNDNSISLSDSRYSISVSRRDSLVRPRPTANACGSYRYPSQTRETSLQSQVSHEGRPSSTSLARAVSKTSYTKEAFGQRPHPALRYARSAKQSHRTTLPQRADAKGDQLYFISRAGLAYHAKKTCEGLSSANQNGISSHTTPPQNTTPCKLCCAGTEEERKKINEWVMRKRPRKAK